MGKLADTLSSAAAALLSAAAGLLCWLSAAANSLLRLRRERRMDGVALDDMDWGPGSVAKGIGEAEDAKIALISAVLTQDGAGSAKAGDSDAC